MRQLLGGIAWDRRRLLELSLDRGRHAEGDVRALHALGRGQIHIGRLPYLWCRQGGKRHQSNDLYLVARQLVGCLGRHLGTAAPHANDHT